jgi:hypothetical protein
MPERRRGALELFTVEVRQQARVKPISNGSEIFATIEPGTKLRLC